MDSAVPMTNSEEPPSPLPTGPLVNLIGTGIALLTLFLPTVTVSYYSQAALTASSFTSSTATVLVVQSPIAQPN